VLGRRLVMARAAGCAQPHDIDIWRLHVQLSMPRSS
jgi:hypothetical protein